MAEPIVHETFVVERHYDHPMNRVFAAFADPSQKRAWYADSRGHDVDAFESDFRIGGVDRFVCRLRATSPFPGLQIDTNGRYLDIATNQRIVIASRTKFAGETRSASLMTFEFIPVRGGVDMIYGHQGAFYEGSDGAQAREKSWRKLFDQLSVSLNRHAA